MVGVATHTTEHDEFAPRRVMLRRWFFSLRPPLPVFAIDFLDRHSEKLRKGSPNFSQTCTGDSNMEGSLFVCVPLCTLRQGFRNLHEVVHTFDEVLWKAVGIFRNVDEVV